MPDVLTPHPTLFHKHTHTGKPRLPIIVIKSSSTAAASPPKTQRHPLPHQPGSTHVLPSSSSSSFLSLHCRLPTLGRPPPPLPRLEHYLDHSLPGPLAVLSFPYPCPPSAANGKQGRGEGVEEMEGRRGEGVHILDYPAPHPWQVFSFPYPCPASPPEGKQGREEGRKVKRDGTRVSR